MRSSQAVFLLFLGGLLAGCASLAGPKYPTLIPTEYVPTAIALTVEAGRSAALPTPVMTPSLTSPALPSSTNTLPAPATPARTATAATPSATPAGLTTTPDRTASRTPTARAGQASLTPPPSDTPSATPGTLEASPTSTGTPTITPTPRYYRTPSPTATPGIISATILMYSPGPMSKLTSPIQFNASLQPGPSGRVLIELLGEEGRLLYRKLIRYTTQEWVAISDLVDFNISAAAETARLQISTEDDEGRVMALASVDLLLLSMGDDDLNPSTDLSESLIIREPLPNILIQGGKVVVTGLVRTGGERPLLVELVDAKGAVVGYRQAVTSLPDDPWATQGYATFRAEVPYSVDGATWVRLAVSAFEDRLPGPTHLSSLVILLGP